MCICTSGGSATFSRKSINKRVAEVLDGEMYMMACPSTTHQLVLMWLGSQIFRKIHERGGKCKAIPSPLAVYLKNDDKKFSGMEAYCCM